MRLIPSYGKLHKHLNADQSEVLHDPVCRCAPWNCRYGLYHRRDGILHAVALSRMKQGKRWGPGVFAFYLGVAGGCAQLVPIYKSLPITYDDFLPTVVQISIGAAIGAVIGAVIGWVRNLFIP